MKPSPYDTDARKEIAAWKDPELGWVGKAMEIINWPLNKAGDVIMEAPGVGWVIEKSVGGIVGVANDAAQWSVRQDAIWKEYQGDGHPEVKGHDDVFKLDLQAVDKSIGYLAAKYKGAALTEGAAMGALGLPGIPPDIIALVAMNLRAIGEYATYCGFDNSRQHERMFAMNVLGLASSPNDAAKGLAMAQLVKIAQDVAKKKTWKVLEKYAFVQIIQQIAKALGIRLTKAKLAQAGQGDAEVFLADATLYLELFGLVTVAWQWLKQGVAARAGLAAAPGAERAAFLQGKLVTMRYFFHYELPKTAGLAARLLEEESVTAHLGEEVFAD